MSKSVLEQILLDKRAEIERKKRDFPLVDVENPNVVNKIDFLKHFDRSKLFIIAEVKKASPSKGIIREDFNPVEIAKAYERAGASAISVLTDEKYFLGSLDFLKSIRKEVSVPLLRKDFIIDSYQIKEAYYAGASAILLIVAALSKDQLKEYIKIASAYSLSSLIEVHDEFELEIALDVEARLIGINNRNLNTFETNLNQTEKLISLIPKNKIVISESGINSLEDVKYLKSMGVSGLLIGEALMREKDIEKKLKSLIL
ncbi:MAG: indole-3-glycerol phosphate synthase TrpC [Spirochaetota bacterium]|nr:indole-3-glycerol phosphate synthase TrpC [Spirochaetota bacterium]